MATNFPNSVDSLTNPTTSDTLASVSHSAQHADANDAIEAIQTALLDGAPLKIDDANNRVGINDTTPSYTLDVNGDINTTGAIYYSGTEHKRIVFGGDTTLNVANSATGGSVLYKSITPTAPFTGLIYVVFMGNTGFNVTSKFTQVGFGTTSAPQGNVYDNFRAWPPASEWTGVSTHYQASVTSGNAADVGLWVRTQSSGGTTYLRGHYKWWWIET